MRASSLYLALGAAHLAACAPTTTTTTTKPVVLADHLKALASSHAAASAQDATSTSSSTTTTYWVPFGDRPGSGSSPHPGPRPPPRKNHHSPSDPPPPPPPTLSRHHRPGDGNGDNDDVDRRGGRRRTGRGPRRGHRKVDLVPLRITVDVDGSEGDDDGSGQKSTQVVDVGVPSDWLSSPPTQGQGGKSPYPPPPSSRHGRGGVGVTERNDMLVVVLVAAFVVFVVLVETWESLFRRQGVIRLEDTPGQLPLPVSVRAVPGGYDGPEDEKRRA